MPVNSSTGRRCLSARHFAIASVTRLTGDGDGVSEARAGQCVDSGHPSCSGASTMSTLDPVHPPIEILPPPIGSIEDRERRLIEAVVALTRSLRDERDRLAVRLREVEIELRR